eukprot:CAMPEP_0119065004 /NCGR_PEP_ID=MMETSP1178-20130426/7929_1 /TAXON_ID=33656 /ORGANISM="unid sp, Strain CCMP2000" /LENGTH=65 /DNA_ID=CAMNT_0007046485 /DNA_START=225 /DNA_END=422 /DNA_ORIENTATION=-
MVVRPDANHSHLARAPKLALQIPWTQTAQGAGKAEKLKTSTFVRRRPSHLNHKTTGMAAQTGSWG